MRTRAMASELRVIRTARRNGARLGVHPQLTKSQVQLDREAYLVSVLERHKRIDPD